MPKKFSIADKNNWLERYESGKSEASIAKESKCDLRTVRRGIEDARRERDARFARIDLLKQAVLKHQESLLNKLGEILTSLQVPPWDWAVLSWHKDADSILNESDFDTEYTWEEESNKESKDSGAQGDMVEGMLRQHLKGDKLWKLLDKREQIYASHRLARIALQRKVANLLEEETGYELKADSHAQPPFLYSYITGDLFYQMSLADAFGHSKSDAWLDEIVADSSAGRVRYHDSTLAEVPGKADKCRKRLADAFAKMRALPELTRVVNTYHELEESTSKAKQAIEEIRLLGLVPGACKTCRRLGM